MLNWHSDILKIQHKILTRIFNTSTFFTVYKYVLDLLLMLRLNTMTNVVTHVICRLLISKMRVTNRAVNPGLFVYIVWDTNNRSRANESAKDVTEIQAWYAVQIDQPDKAKC